MKKRHLIIIEWDDAFGNGKWHEEGEVGEVKLMRCTTVGWRMPSSRGYFDIASSRDSSGRCADRMTIPRSSIKSIRRLAVESLIGDG